MHTSTRFRSMLVNFLMVATSGPILVCSHLSCLLLRPWSHHHDACVVDVKDVVFVHNPPAENLGSILSKPPAQRPTPHKDLQHVRWTLDKTFGLDAIRVRLRPEHSKACRTCDCKCSTNCQNWGRLHHEEPVTASTGREEGQEVGHRHLQVDRRGDLSIRNATKPKLPHH